MVTDVVIHKAQHINWKAIVL